MSEFVHNFLLFLVSTDEFVFFRGFLGVEWGLVFEYWVGGLSFEDVVGGRSHTSFFY
jgi:hypothetical protein